MALTDFLTQIADSIRSKDGTTEPIIATDFPQRILDIPSGGGSDNGLFFQEYSSASDVNIYASTLNIDLNVNDVEWLIMFPMQSDAKSQYSCPGGVYIPDVLGRLDRTAYNVKEFSTMGCGSGTDMTVSNGVLSLHRSSNNAYVMSGLQFGIVGKEKK